MCNFLLSESSINSNAQKFIVEMKTALHCFIVFSVLFNSNSSFSQNCGGYIPADSSYSIAISPSDDGSSIQLSLPFNFCFYGINYNSLYINNNGNITFGLPLATFSTSPPYSFPMLSVFGGDVDTRGIGTVKYKITPTAIFINWENVGYYNSHTDKTNTFSLVITDGNDTIIPPGQNVGLNYYDMNWTTGDASGGTSGFGGSGANIFLNKGDSINYASLGLFDQSGGTYDGNYGLNDGISWLTGKTIYLNTCTSSNLPPAICGKKFCDSLYTCTGPDTLLLDYYLLSPEPLETTTVSLDSSSSPGISISGLSNANTSHFILQVIKNQINTGTNWLTFSGIDNSTPAESNFFRYTVFLVDTTTTSISGQISYSGGNVAGSNVVLYHYLPYYMQLDTVETTTTDTSGSYNFSAVPQQDYLIKVFPASSYTTLVPTYNGNYFHWPNASPIVHGCSPDIINISMAELTSSGSGFSSINGRILEGAGFGRAPGDPVPGIDVKLGRNPSGQLIANTETNSNGEYSFNNMPVNLPGESYILIVDIPGIGSDSSYTFTMVSDTTVNNLNYTVDSTTIHLTPGIIGINELTNGSHYIVYPNPSKGNATIEYKINSDMKVELGVYNVLGFKISELVNAYQIAGTYKYSMNNYKHLSAGIYFIVLTTNGKKNILKIIITE